MRVSTDEQGESGLGLESQRAAIRHECSRRGWDLVDIFEDSGASGKALTGRPALRAALLTLQKGQASGIVVSKLDRLSRSLLDFAHLLHKAQREQWNLVALDLGVDLSTPAGEFLASVMSACAQWEARVIGQRTKEALAVKKSQGYRLGRPPSISDAVAQRILRMRARGVGLQEICERLNMDRVPTPRGGKAWRPSSIQSVVTRTAGHTSGDHERRRAAT